MWFPFEATRGGSRPRRECRRRGRWRREGVTLYRPTGRPRRGRARTGGWGLVGGRSSNFGARTGPFDAEQRDLHFLFKKWGLILWFCLGFGWIYGKKLPRGRKKPNSRNKKAGPRSDLVNYIPASLFGIPNMYNCALFSKGILRFTK